MKFSKALGDQAAWDNRTSIYLASAAIAEFIADIFLCPLEACRIRLVNEPTFAPNLPATASRLLKEEGFIRGFYSGFVPMLFKQVPYTMAKFAVQGKAAEMICNSTGISLDTAGSGTKMGLNLSSGVIAGVAAAIISHPADSLLSKVNKPGAGGDGPMMQRLGNIIKQEGMWKLSTQGLGARCVMIGSLTAGQFAIFEQILNFFGASSFHFHDPRAHH